MLLTKTYPSGKIINNVFDELFNSFPSSWGTDVRTSSAVAVNINENENSFNIEFNAPGRNKEDFKINIENGLLTVSYEKKAQTEEKDVKSIRREYSFESFKRSFSLDEKINVDGIEAKYENGILRVVLPKKEEVKVAPKQISIL